MDNKEGEEEKKLYLFWSVQTSGLPKTIGYQNYHSPKLFDPYYNNARIVSFSWIIRDSSLEQEKEVTRGTVIFQPDGFTITNSCYHGITQEMALKEGISFPKFIQDYFQPYLLPCFTDVVGHYVNFAYHVFMAELYRYNLMEVVQAFDKKRFICTMLEAKMAGLQQDTQLSLPELAKSLQVSSTIEDLSKEELALLCFAKLKSAV